MTTRTMGPAAGWRWLMAAVNLGGSNPKAIFGGAALLLAVVFAAAMALSVLLALVMPEAGGAQMAGSVLVTLPLLALMAALMVGYLRLIDAVEDGRPATATQVFSGFADRGAWMQAVVILVVLAVLQYLLMAGGVMLVAPDAGRWYLENMASATAVTPDQVAEMPPGFGRLLAVVMVVGVLTYAAQALALGQVALRNRGIGGALADGAAGAVRNVLPLVVLMLLGLVAMLVFGLVIGLLAVLFGGLAGGSGAAMMVAMAIGIPVYLLVVLVMVVVSFGVMYAMWRDICGDGDGDRDGAGRDDGSRVAA